MMHNQTTNFGSLAAQFFLGSIALSLVILAFFWLHVDLASTPFAYLVVILLFSLMGSFTASALLAVMSIAGLACFFAPPIFQFDSTTKPILELVAQRTHPEGRAAVQKTIDRAFEDRKRTLVQRELTSHPIPLRTELASALPMILGDRVQLQQVIINLVMNGIEAMQPVTDRPRELMIRSGQEEPRRVFVSVTDCGVRISAENANRLFNAFFTTKSSGLGTGLSICRPIVEAHGGRLSASDNEGPGAMFQFVLPLHQEEAHQEEAS